MGRVVGPRGPRHDDDERLMIRTVAATPGRTEWLRRIIVHHAHRIADQLAAQGMGEAATVARSYADSCRRGEVTLW